MLQFLRIPIWEHPCLEADQMIVAYKSLASLSRSTDLIQHVARLGFCTYILGYLWTALFKSGSNLQRVQHVAGSCVTSAGQCCTYLYLSVPSPPSVPVLIRTTRTAKLYYLSVPTLFICTYLYVHRSQLPNYNSYLTICTFIFVWKRVNWFDQTRGHQALILGLMSHLQFNHFVYRLFSSLYVFQSIFQLTYTN